MNVKEKKRINKKTPVIDEKRSEKNTRERVTQKNIDEDGQLAAIIRESPYPILICDIYGNILYKNNVVRNIIDGLGLDSPALFLPENHAELIKLCTNDRKPYKNHDIRIKGQVFSWTYNPIPERSLVHLHGFDVTDQKFLEEKLLHESLHDKLTGLPNRSFFYNELLRSIKISHRRDDYHFAVLFLDLGKFKEINDTLGHLAGDKVLTQIASRLASCLRPEDTAARFGGDEFTILLNNISGISDPVNIAERIQKQISMPMNIEGHEIFPSASIGIVLSNPDYLQPEDFIRDANTAMYCAKEQRSVKYVVFDEKMNRDEKILVTIESSLKKAIAENQFCLFYQPIISLDSGRIAGFEALLRWQHPGRGIVSPDEFIPFIEESGQIIHIGGWVIKKACSQLRDWHRKYPNRRDLFISVNISAKQFIQPDFVKMISEILKEENLYPGYLCMEITESIIVSNHTIINSAISELRKMDIQISIDDFGIAYSSLSNLHRYPIQSIKIDRSFIKVINDKEWTSVIPNTIISIGKHLEIDVIAEGVETAGQLNQLKNLDCGYAQGNYFSPPLDSIEAEHFLLNN